MLRVALSILALAASALLAYAQLELQLQFPRESKYKVWVGAKPPQGDWPADAKAFEGRSAVFTPGAFAPSDSVFVIDEISGNLASKPLAQAKSPVSLTFADFSKIGRVWVRVEHKGRPVQSASVSMKSGSDERTQLLDASSEGETSFFAVNPGQIRVSVRYRNAKGETPEPISQIADAKLDRQQTTVNFIISIPDEVATLPVSDAPDQSQPGRSDVEEPREQGGMGVLGRIVSFLLALAVAGALLFFGLRWMKANQDRVQANLSSLGVEIPGQDPEPPTTGHSPAAPIAPPPPEQILLDDAAPDPPVFATAATGAVLLAEPRLVSEDGSEILVDEGSLFIGRDAEMGLSLLDESTVSRRHAELIRTGETVVLKDLGSTNGTYVNGRKVDGEVTLRPGDKVQFGAVRFRFEA